MDIERKESIFVLGDENDIDGDKGLFENLKDIFSVKVDFVLFFVFELLFNDVNWV